MKKSRLDNLLDRLRRKHCLHKTCVSCDNKNDKGECLNYFICEIQALVRKLEKEEKDNGKQR